MKFNQLVALLNTTFPRIPSGHRKRNLQQYAFHIQMWMANFFAATVWIRNMFFGFLSKNWFLSKHTKKTIQTWTAHHSMSARRIPLWKIKPLSLDSVSPVLLTTWFISLYEANPCLPQDNVILRPLLLSSTSQSCLPADAHLLKSFQAQGCYSLGPHYNLISIPLKFQHNSGLLRHKTNQHRTLNAVLAVTTSV